MTTEQIQEQLELLSNRLYTIGERLSELSQSLNDELTKYRQIDQDLQADILYVKKDIQRLKE